MASSALAKYLDKTGRLPEDVMLGSIAVTTIQEGAYPRDELKQLFANQELDVERVPPTSTAMDAFNKACNRREYEYVMPNGSKGFLEVRPVTSTNPAEYVSRAIVRREQVRTRPQLEYDKVGEIILYRGVRRGPQRRMDDSAARITVRVARWDASISTDEGEWNTITSFAAQIKRDWDRYTTTLDGNAMRKMVRTYLRERLDAVKIKDSVYFTPQVHADELDRLRDAINAIDGCRLDLIPLLDLADQREHVIRAFQEDTEEQLRSLAVELQRAMNDRVTPKTYMRLKETYDTTLARVQTYTDALGESTIRTSSNLDVVTGLLAALSRSLLNGKEKA